MTSKDPVPVPFARLSQKSQDCVVDRIASIEKHWATKLPEAIAPDLRPAKDPKNWGYNFIFNLHDLTKATAGDLPRAQNLLRKQYLFRQQEKGGQARRTTYLIASDIMRAVKSVWLPRLEAYEKQAGSSTLVPLKRQRKKPGQSSRAMKIAVVNGNLPHEGNGSAVVRASVSQSVPAAHAQNPELSRQGTTQRAPALLPPAPAPDSSLPSSEDLELLKVKLKLAQRRREEAEIKFAIAGIAQKSVMHIAYHRGYNASRELTEG
ncbi:hypothetical protein H2201_002519 [Coniosporium apollinis]|uniref:Uncharacterized protein n=2 Tax=Coniosporium TaxID=2810619 RepID=A0ABQ9NZB4_9PEZI|nr:hypothetical protein H2199_005972 [Cladosporium sp. JES 115]KAJ9667318.1 hypothetical protein H2201_002519 [Coniosporium apollinis]